VLAAGLPLPARGGFSARTGGVSGAPYDSLNLGSHVDDDVAAVAENRERLRRSVGIDALVFAEQVHGTRVAVVRAPHDGDVPGTDALVTTTPGLGLVVMAADCLPVLLADAEAGVVAAAHAGRAGLAAGVLQQTLAAMAGRGADASRTVAVIGPAACGRCYELPRALADEVGRAVPGSRSTTRTGTASVDLAAGAAAVLQAAGLARVDTVGQCTIEQPERWFSYRRDGRTGRHAGVVWLTR
jgi:YfiH family protein